MKRNPYSMSRLSGLKAIFSGLVALFLLGSAGCGGSDSDGGSDPGPTGPEISAQTIFISSKRGNDGVVDRVNGLFQGQAEFFSGNNEGVALDIVDNLFHAGDVDAENGVPGSLRVICGIRDRASGQSFDERRDRLLGGAEAGLPGLVSPKGVAIAHRAGYAIIANFNGFSLKVFGTAAAGNVAPVATAPLPANPWDVVYDDDGDRLFASLTDGTVAVFENFTGTNLGAAGPTRFIIPVDLNRTRISTNLHGIDYDARSDRLVVSDVGAANAVQGAGFENDGSIYVIDNASRVGGEVQPAKIITGPATRLGNPVDIILTGSELRVADNVQDVMLVFSNVFTTPGGNVEPDFVVGRADPESLVATSTTLLNPDVTDITIVGTPIRSVALTSNPSDPLDFGAITHLSPQLNAVQATFDAERSLENLTFDQAGDAYVTFDDGDNVDGGVLIVNRLAKSRDGSNVAFSRDRIISGNNTGLISPKGLDVVDSLSLLLVAENNADTPGIRVFGTCANGNIRPLAEVNLRDFGRPWDLDYDPLNDRLFVALTNGKVAVFDNYSSGLGSRPNRIIVPSDAAGQPLATNLHGVIYVAGRDVLLLSDIGDPADDSDGQLLVLANVTTVAGPAPVRVQIAGPDTLLGNPVDITFDGSDLYVAEKANEVVLKFDNIIDQASGNIPPLMMNSQTSPESVALVPEFLSAVP